MRLKLSAVLLVISVCCADAVVWARAVDMQKPCSDCHTMHSSQGGVGGSVRDALLKNSCYGCHSDAVAHVDTPVVWHITTVNYGITGTELGNHNTLAGGDFKWVAGVGGNLLQGHDVIGIATLGTPTLTCAGATGCHGTIAIAGDTTAMAFTHHAVETAPAQPSDGSPLSESFRWLDGIAGYEDPDYELTVSSGEHNQYKGIARTLESDSTASSISNSCARCHGDFHTGTDPAGISDDASSFGGAGTWIRHPVDYAMSLTVGTEYAGYGKPAVGDYNIATPLGSVDVSTVKGTVAGINDRIITCVSCHRAHGSPYNYNLRWNYLAWPTAGYNGCGDCHTAKN